MKNQRIPLLLIPFFLIGCSTMLAPSSSEMVYSVVCVSIYSEPPFANVMFDGYMLGTATVSPCLPPGSSGNVLVRWPSGAIKTGLIVFDPKNGWRQIRVYSNPDCPFGLECEFDRRFAHDILFGKSMFPK